MAAVQETVDRVRRIDVDQYRYGFETVIESDKAPKGLSEDTVRFISAKKNEPAWMLEWRLEAYRRWLTMTEPTWARVNYPRIDYQDLYYYSAPKPKKQVSSLDEIDPEILKTYEKLGIPLREVEVLEGVAKPEGERKIAVDAVFDSVSETWLSSPSTGTIRTGFRNSSAPGRRCNTPTRSTTSRAS